MIYDVKIALEVRGKSEKDAKTATFLRNQALSCGRTFTQNQHI